MDDELKSTLAEISERVRVIEGYVAQPKRGWLAGAAQVATIFIALIGVVFTAVYQINQSRLASMAHEANLRHQNLQAFSALFTHLSNGDTAQQRMAVAALRELGSCDLAVLAARLYPSRGTEAGLLELRRVARIDARSGCSIADTVYESIPFPDLREPGPGQIPAGLPVETIPRAFVDSIPRTRPLIPQGTPEELRLPRRN